MMGTLPRSTALTGDVVDVIFVEAAFDFNGVDEGRTDGKAQDRRVVVIGLVHFRQLALIAREEDRRLFGITGTNSRAFQSWDKLISC